jgi:hypothetical protein
MQRFDVHLEPYSYISFRLLEFKQSPYLTWWGITTLSFNVNTDKHSL